MSLKAWLEQQGTLGVVLVLDDTESGTNSRAASIYRHTSRLYKFILCLVFLFPFSYLCARGPMHENIRRNGERIQLSILRMIVRNDLHLPCTFREADT